jgi:hypothetical protein
MTAPRKNPPRNVPVNLGRCCIARERYFRRIALWANARARLGDAAFFESFAAVERSVARQLRREFPAFTK